MTTPTIGMDFGDEFALERAVELAAEHGLPCVDVRLDDDALDLETYDEETVEAIRSTCEDNEISLGLHTLSAVNTAALTPIVEDGVEAYLRRFVDIAALVDADRVIVHAGYHFKTDEDARREASIERLDDLATYAEEKDVLLVLENMNPEPEDAEVHYLCSTLDDCKTYFEALDSPNVRWAFNPPHANLQAAGVEGFLDEFGIDRCEEVRLNDNRGVREEHLFPGEGTIDFEALFERLQAAGYDGHYVIALWSIEDMIDGIEYLEARFPDA